MNIIKFNNKVIAEGRNGLMKQVGLEISSNGKDHPISIFPINTKGIGRGMIQIDRDSIPELIEILMSYQKK